jgi:hypothetical protein
VGSREERLALPGFLLLSRVIRLVACAGPLGCDPLTDPTRTSLSLAGWPPNLPGDQHDPRRDGHSDGRRTSGNNQAPDDRGHDGHDEKTLAY